MRNLQQAFLISSALALTLAAQGSFAAPKHDNPGKQSGGQHSDINTNHQGPSIDIGQIRIVLGENHNLIGPTRALPPGITKNLAKGKPLPPGIAKNFDSRLQGRLPHYDGYEWKQMGTDMVLVTIATGIIYEVLHNILD
ncbi:MAG: anti-virulence regulator CigR family protein [Pseudomonas sp.]|uniref:anti-virulence regulator CigR family protein n=1 Tax=Pseudomonas sp. TaxID=306 RepID=UPI0039819934